MELMIVCGNTAAILSNQHIFGASFGRLENTKDNMHLE
jgi:hypothetical protein